MLTFPEKLVFGLILIGAMTYFVSRTVTLVRFLRCSKSEPENSLGPIAPRLAKAALDVIFQRDVLRKPWVGAFHLLIVWGFFVFTVNTINHFAGAFVPRFNLFGNTFIAPWYAATADVFAVLIIVGVLGLAFRRYVLRPACLTRPSIESAVVFTFIGGAMAAYLFANATENAMGLLDHPRHHFISARIGAALTGLNPAGLRMIAHIAWWCDALMHLVLVALLVIPTKHMHLVAGPFNLVYRKARPRGQMSMVNLEEESPAPEFGVSKIEQFTWKQNLDLYACIECGRCQDFCPTANSEKPLRPKHLIHEMKHHLLHRGPFLLKASKTEPFNSTTPTEEGAVSLIGGVVTEDALWACTTCAACVEHCPMGIEHIDKIADMRRHLVLMDANFPEQADTTFRNMETAGNPWGFAPTERALWAKGLDVPLMAEKQEVDVLYWVGCSGSYDDRSRRISRAMVRILNAAGIDFAILGEEERCTCESARRLGNEYLYQMATQEITETLRRYRFRRMLVTCPHCLNTFTNEYRQFGLGFPVVHHAQLIRELLAESKLSVGAGNGESVVYHDSCYLGRYNGIFDAPRQVIEAMGYDVAGVPRERRQGFCCGAGGGRMWLEERIGKPINTLRVRELMESKAETIAAACPFCITMLTDALKKETTSVQIKDIAEIVEEGLRSIHDPGPGTAQCSESWLRQIIGRRFCEGAREARGLKRSCAS